MCCYNIWVTFKMWVLYIVYRMCQPLDGLQMCWTIVLGNEHRSCSSTHLDGSGLSGLGMPGMQYWTNMHTIGTFIIHHSHIIYLCSVCVLGISFLNLGKEWPFKYVCFPKLLLVVQCYKVLLPWNCCGNNQFVLDSPDLYRLSSKCC